MKKKLLVFALTIMLVSTLVFCLCSCDDKKASEEDDYVCAHEFVEVASQEYLKEAATCTSQAVYYKSCTKCKAAGADTFKFGEYKDHNYENDVCSACGSIKESVYNDALDSKGYVIRNDSIYFGSYPQTLVLNSSLLVTLNSTIKAYPSYSDSGDWTSFGYTESSSGAEYMWYIDVNVAGGKYRALYFASYRPIEKGKSNTIDESSQDNNGYYTNTIYWFKYEPIRWTIIQEGNGSALIVSSLVLDSQEYYENTSSRQINEERIYSSNYESSSIRTWLNETFYNTAFVDNQKILLINELLDNKNTSDAVNNRYAQYQNNTKDQVFLLSYQDLVSNSKLNTAASRIKKATEYSKALGTNTDNSIYVREATWITRSAHNLNGYQIYGVLSNGSIDGFTTNYTNSGIVPAVRIRICSSTSPQGHEFAEIINEEALKEEATCEHEAIYYKTCRFCGAKSTETFSDGEKLGHVIVEVEDSRYLKSAVSCTEPYIFYKSCSRCQKALEETFSVGVPLGHNHDITKIVEPTCEEQGYNNHICSRCGHEIHDTFTDALEHIIVENTSEDYLIHAATCTEPTTYYKSCSRCGQITDETFTVGNALGHIRTELIEDKYLKTAATCTAKAIYHKACSRCLVALEDTYGYGEALGHDYIATVNEPSCIEEGYSSYQCTRCTDNYVDNVTKAIGHKCGDDYICDNCGKVCYSGNYLRVGDIMYFGSYPQKRVTKQSLITALNALAYLPSTTPSDSTYKWTKYDKYFVNGQEKEFMWYIDIELYGEKFRGVYFVEERTEYINTEWSAYVDSTYEANNVYWFSYEPIKWQIIEALSGSVLMYSCLAIDAQDFNYSSTDSQIIDNITYYSNDLKISHIRNWLNDTFYNAAFNYKEQNIIELQEITSVTPFGFLYSVDNYVSLLSSNDLVNYSYGFDDADATLSRSMKGTDYAKSQGLQYSKDAYAGSALWWSRSPKSSTVDQVAAVNIDGSIFYSSVLHANYGVLPVIRIRLNSCVGDHEYVTSIVEPTCEDNGYTLYVCKHCASSYIGNETPSLGHTYNDGICRVCGYADADDVKNAYELKGYAKCDDIIYFGYYPQSRMANLSITNVLDNKAGELPTAEDPKKWTNYGFYKSGSNSTAYMWYIEIYYGAKWYRGVYFTEYRPIDPNDDGSPTNSYIYGNGYEAGQIYWFSYEVIKWLVIRQKGELAYLNADLALDNQFFYYTESDIKERTINNETIYENNYEYSFIRNWLNDTFYNSAFSELQKSLIQTVAVDNRTTSMSADSTKDYSKSQNITYDKIYIPSIADLTDVSSGYQEDFLENDWYRQNESSDYAKILGTYRFDGGGLDKNGYAMTRSCSDSGPNQGMQTDYAGNIVPYTVYELCGVNMSLVIKITECDLDTEHDFVDGVCTKCGAVHEDELLAALNTKNYVEGINDVIYMGLYPQELVCDSNLLSSLNATYLDVPNKYISNDWTEYETLNNTNPYIWTFDATINGKKYRAVYFSEYRREEYGSEDKNEGISMFSPNTVYWFKYTPIKWSKVKNIDGGELLVANLILDASMYSKSSIEIDNPSNWCESYLYDFLYDNFYTSAFTSNQTKYLQAFANGEYVSLITEEDYLMYKNVQNDSCEKYASYYAQCMGVKTSIKYNNQYGCWYINKAYDATNVYYIDIDGEEVENAFVTSTYYGVVPAIQMNYCNVKHDFIKNSTQANLLTEATCTKKSVYYYSCSRCGEKSTETYEDGSILGHDFEYYCNGTCKCQRCEKEESLYVNDGETIKMGYYPQSLVSDATIIQYLNNSISGYPPTNLEGWVAYSKVNASSNDATMWYIDVEFDNNFYRGLYFSSKNENQTALGYKVNTLYWFKYDQILWRVVVNSDGSVTLISDKALDGIAYASNSIEENITNYRLSNIREWLNNFFVETAFNSGIQSILLQTIIDNSAKSTGFHNEENKVNNYSTYDTLDKVWILSVNDYSNSEYGFTENNNNDDNRVAETTEYALALGIDKDTSLTRSPSATVSTNVAYVDASGVIKYAQLATKANVGIVPVVKINIIEDHEFVEEVINPTCTEQGYTLHKCSKCGYEYKTNYVAALGHTGGKATCQAKAICSRCKNEYGSLLDHNMVDGICSMCGVIDEDALNASIESKGYAHSEDVVYFGYYPQELITNSSIISALEDSLVKPDEDNNNGWTSYGYYAGSSNATNYMWYLDKTYGGSKYRGVYFTSYRPSKVTELSIPENSNQDENGYYINTIYWFKYTPIKWRIITSDSNVVTMISTIALDSQSFQDTTYYIDTKSDYYAYKDGIAAGTKYANDYAVSSIRSWLNSEFINTAFTSDNQLMILETQLDNTRTALQADVSKYSVAQTDTKDKVYILSYSDYINEDYGYNASALVNDTYKRVYASEYALAQGISNVDGKAIYLSRSPYYSKGNIITTVNENGNSSGKNETGNTSLGVVPVIQIDFCAIEHNYTRIIDDKYIKTEATCLSKAVYYSVCTHCGLLSTETYEYGELSDHDYSDEIVEATCIKDGKITRTCKVCKNVEEVTIPALGHTGGKATCSDKAICDRCHEEYGEYLPHHYLKETIVVNATCLEEGYIIHTCADCGYEYREITSAALGHSGGRATCITKAKCDRCFEEYGDYAEHNYISTVIAPTCTDSGCTVHICSVCSNQYVSNYTDELGHNFISSPSGAYLHSKANCTCAAIYYQKCSRCGLKSDKKYEVGEAIGHKYSNGICTVCGDKVVKRVNENGRETIEGNYVLFGSYPQTEVKYSTNKDLVDALCIKSGIGTGSFSKETLNDNSWTHAAYAIVESESQTTNINFYFKDIDYMGTRYRGIIYYDNLRSANTNGYVANQVYWFMFEPIKWQIVYQTNGEALLISDLVIDGHDINTKYTPDKYWSDYAVRTWLNEAIYYIAFRTIEETSLILDTKLANSITALDWKKNEKSRGQADTTDKLFLMSYNELCAAPSVYKFRSATDYAKYNCAKVTNTGEYAIATRSSGPMSDFSINVSIYDKPSSYNVFSVTSTQNIAPAIRIRLCENHLYENGRCAYCGDVVYTTRTINDNKYYYFGQYPQSKVTDESIITDLTQLCGKTPDADDSLWTTYEYNNETSVKYAWYRDIELYGVKYRAFYCTMYRPLRSSQEASTTNLSNILIDINTLYFYKYEDIEWVEIADEFGESTLVSTHNLDITDYGKTSKWADSNLREWLNDNFYNTAFSSVAKSLILESFVDNKTNNLDLMQINTYDKVYALGTDDNAKYSKVITSPGNTEYSTSQGRSTGYYYSRSTATLYSQVYAYKGESTAQISVDSNFEVLPEIRITNCIHTYEFTAGCLICSKCRRIIYQRDSQNNTLMDMGYYPTDEVKDNSIVTELNKLVTNSDYDKLWTVGYSVLINSVKTNIMYYTDVLYNGEKYRCIIFTQYKPTTFSIDSTPTKDESNLDENGYDINKVYWFKFTKLKWVESQLTDGTRILVCNTVIDARQFDDEGSSNWIDSSLYYWLNTAFIADALDNHIMAASINKEVRLMSLQEANVLIELGYTFEASDYAKAQGVEMEDSNVTYATMTSYSSVEFYAINGATSTLADSSYTYYGVVPVIIMQ